MELKFEEEIDLIINKTTDMGIIEYAVQDAMEKGIEKGMEQGIGKGKLENQLTTAVKLIQLGSLTLEQISNITEISLDKIKSIIKSN